MQSLVSTLSRWQPPRLSSEQAEEIDRRRAEDKAAEDWARVVKAGIPKLFRYATLDDVCQQAADFAANVIEGGKCHGLYLVGAVGTGKTHTACAIAHDCAVGGVSVAFANTLTLLGEIRSTYGTSQSDEDVISRYITRRLLVLDDFGKESPTDWALSMLFRIVNSRYESESYTVITTQYSEPELMQRLSKNGDRNTAQAIMSRIAGTYRKTEFSGRDRRLER